MSTTALPEILINAPRSGDFEACINLLAVIGEANRQLAELTREIEGEYLEIVTGRRERYARLQACLTENEAALEVIVRRNESWFADKKSVTTPYGAVKFKKSSELMVANEEAAITLIKLAGRPELIRSKEELNREALSELKDEDLAKFGLARRVKENLTVDTDVIDLGKAVKAADKSNAKAAATAKKAAALTGSAKP